MYSRFNVTPLIVKMFEYVNPTQYHYKIDKIWTVLIYQEFAKFGVTRVVILPLFISRI